MRWKELPRKWRLLPLFPTPFSPVHKARKLSTVFGTTSWARTISTRPKANSWLSYYTFRRSCYYYSIVYQFLVHQQWYQSTQQDSHLIVQKPWYNHTFSTAMSQQIKYTHTTEESVAYLPAEKGLLELTEINPLFSNLIIVFLFYFFMIVNGGQISSTGKSSQAAPTITRNCSSWAGPGRLHVLKG